MRPYSSGLATFTCFYVLIKRVKQLTEKRTLKAPFFYRKQRKVKARPKSSLWLTAVVSLANQIIWKIITRIVIGLF